MQPDGRPKDHRFIDAHVHIQDPSGYAAVTSAGVAAIRDAGAKGRALNGIERPHAGSPVVVTSGWAIFSKGGYGSRFGRPVTNRAEIISEILALKHAGADIIKVMASGLVSLKKSGTVTAGGFSRDELAFIVETAGGLKLRVMAHANGEEAIIAAADTGVLSIEHGFFMTERALDFLIAKRIYWTPTVGALKRALKSGDVSPEAEQFLTGLIQSHLAMMRKAHALGVPLAVGTDCVLPGPDYKAAYDAELACFTQAGIAPDDVMRIACEGGAGLLGLK